MFQATRLGNQAIVKVNGDAEKLMLEIVRQNSQVLAMNADLLAKLSLTGIFVDGGERTQEFPEVSTTNAPGSARVG